jgi:hypothetical protein
MEIRQVTGIFISFFHDSILGISYGKFLTGDTLESIKLPALLDNYKYKHIISPNNLLTIELVKTKKNWILKTVLEHRTIFLPKCYSDFTQISEIVNLLGKNILEEQKTNALELYVRYLSRCGEICSSINSKEFDPMLQKVLGY